MAKKNGTDDVVRFPRLTGHALEQHRQLENQLDEFERQVRDGKVVCLSDLIANAESLRE